LHSSLCLGSCNCCVHTIRPSHPSPNILQLTSSILKSIRCISKTIFWCLTKYLLLCLNGSTQANCCFAHTTGTCVPCSLYTHLEYNDMAHYTLLTWMHNKLPTQSFFSSSCKDPGVLLERRPIQILGEDVCLIDSTRYPLDHQLTGFFQLYQEHYLDINVFCSTSDTSIVG
jgi:hypothetical protein